MTETLLTIRDVAELLNVSTRTVGRLIEAGEIQLTLVGSSYRFTRDAVNQYVNGHSVTTTATPGWFLPVSS